MISLLQSEFKQSQSSISKKTRQDEELTSRDRYTVCTHLGVQILSIFHIKTSKGQAATFYGVQSEPDQATHGN